MRALSGHERQRLLQAALMMCGSAALLMPLAAQSSYDATAQPGVMRTAPEKISAPMPLTAAHIDVERDPFAADVQAEPVAADSEMEDIALPPNDGAAAMPPAGSTPQTIPLVRAVVLGAQSKALIEENGAVRVLGVGDAVAGATVVSIDPAGIALSNGLRLALVKERR